MNEIFNWYNNNKTGIILSEKTRGRVENILDAIKEKLNESSD